MGAQSSKPARRGEESLERREQRAASLFAKVASSSSSSSSSSARERDNGKTTTSEANFMPKNLDDGVDEDDDDRRKKIEETRRRSSFSSSSSGISKLSKLRETSSIPISQRATDLPKHQQDEKSRTKNWTYPSPKMFYEAIKRKGWQPPEQDIENVVKIHNVVNERCWQEILKWEKEFHPETLGGGADVNDKVERTNTSVSLLRFKGKPRDYSPKARLLNALGYKLPFDRHDWIVDRNGKDVRYVIDFYNAKVPPRGGESSLDVGPIAMHVDVRPALDSPEAFYERAYMQMKWVFSGRWMQ